MSNEGFVCHFDNLFNPSTINEIWSKVGAGAEEGRRDEAADGAAAEGRAGEGGGEKEGAGTKDTSSEGDGEATNARSSKVFVCCSKFKSFLGRLSLFYFNEITT